MSNAATVEQRVIRVVAAVIHENGRYLVCQRPAHKRHALLWEFPGGKCEHGENDADALKRELKEELDVHLLCAGDELYSSRDDGSSFLIVFVEATIEGTIRCSEHTDFAWHTPPELATTALAPSDRRFVEHVLLATHAS